MKDYIKKLRLKIGSQKFIHPAARIIVENKNGEYLSILRKDNGQIGLPAGAFEEGETIEACIRREVQEETGLRIGQLEMIGLSTQPLRESVRYPNGDQVQYFTVEFYSTDYSGDLQPDLEESREAAFRSKKIIQQLPLNEQHTFKSLTYFRRTGKVLID